MKQAFIYNDLVRFYNRSRRKLHHLVVEGKNFRKQNILQKRIARLFKILTGFQHALKLGMTTAALSAGMLLFQPNAVQAQISFGEVQTNPFSLTGVNGYSVPALIDLDGDGDLDMMAGEWFGNFLYFQNIGTTASPVFAAPEGNPFGLAYLGLVTAPAFADLDGDGDMDLLTGQAYGNFFYYENTGTATAPAFAAPQTNPFGLTNIGRSTATFIDVDGDGDMDLMADTPGGDFFYFQNTGTDDSPAFGAAQMNPFGLTNIGSHFVGFFSCTTTFSDLDEDGDMDMISGDLDGNFFYFQNTGTSTAPAFALPLTDPFGLNDIGSYSAPTFADLDGDGDMDLMAGEWYGSFYYFQNITSCTIVFADADGDGYGNAAISLPVSNCIAPSGYVFDTTDCNDNNASIHPGVCDDATNGIDDNCDGLIDNNYATTTYYADVDGDTYGDLNSTKQACTTPVGYVNNTTDCNDANAAIHPSASDVPNGIDDNCNGLIDEPIAFDVPLANPFGLTNIGLSSPALVDLDGDGDMDLMAVQKDWGNFFYFENTGTATAPSFAAAQTNPFGLQDILYSFSPAFADLDGDGDMDLMTGDNYGRFFYFQNTGTAATPAFATAQTNSFGLGAIGGWDSAPAFTDLDGDGDMDLMSGDHWGDFYYFQNIGSASAPAFTGQSNFSLPDVGYNSAPEFVDLDGDGDMDMMAGNFDGNFIYFQNTGTASAPVFAAGQTNPYGLTFSSNWSTPAFTDLDGDGDMDMMTGGIVGGYSYYQNITYCPGLTVYADADGDHYGDVANRLFVTVCVVPNGYALDSTDCNDGNANVHPGASEVCNGIDDNCNSQIDEGVKLTFYADADGDTYGNAASTTQACAAPDGYVSNSADCNDANASIHPGATELCYNGIDDNCNGTIDENCISCVFPSNLNVTDITGTSAKLKWDAAAGAEGYAIQYKTSSANERKHATTNNTSKAINGLLPNTKYKWQVKTYCRIDSPAVSSAWSSAQVFITGVLRMGDVALQEVSFQIYPNPADDQTTIQFTIPQSSHLSVKVYDVSGKEITTLFDGDVQQGDYSLQLNTNHFAKGVYLVKMISDSGIANQKLIVQ